MFKRFLKYAVASAVAVAALGAATYAQTDCATKPANDVIYEAWQKVKEKYPEEVKHMNITFNDGTLKLVGWATTKKIRKDIEKIVKKIECVKKVDNQMTVGKGGGCPPGSIPCGGICIDAKETCTTCFITSKTCN